jgi:DNA polymerase-1
MADKKLLLFDMNNILIKGISKLPYLTHKEKCTTGVYGLLTQMSKYILQHEPTQVVVCNDYPPYVRKELFPLYKYKDRSKDTEQQKKMFQILNESRPYCREILAKLNIPIFEKEGYEADDVIAAIIKKYNKEFSKIVILSNDSDLYQLLGFHNVIMDMGKTGLYSHRELRKEFDIEPSQWLEVLSLAGSHNAVPPIRKGIGQKTAIKILKDSFLLAKEFKEHKKDILLRGNLARLPFEPIDIPNLISSLSQGEKLSTVNFINFCKRKYGIEIKERLLIFARRFTYAFDKTNI